MSRTQVTNRHFLRDFGTSLYFNGSNAEVSRAVSSSLNILGDITVGAWIYRNNTINGENGILSNQKYNIILNTSGNLRFEIDTGTPVTVTSTFPIQPNRWTHVVASYDGTTMRVYVNGVLNNSGANTGAIEDSSAETFRVGRHHTFTQTRFPGFIDEPTVYARKLSDAEVKEWYYNRYVDPTELRLKYLFDEGSGTTANDASGNSNTGTISNATYASNVPFKPRATAGTRTLVT